MQWWQNWERPKSDLDALERRVCLPLFFFVFWQNWAESVSPLFLFFFFSGKTEQGQSWMDPLGRRLFSQGHVSHFWRRHHMVKMRMAWQGHKSLHCNYFGWSTFNCLFIKHFPIRSHAWLALAKSMHPSPVTSIWPEIKHCWCPLSGQVKFNSDVI